MIIRISTNCFQNQRGQSGYDFLQLIVKTYEILPVRLWGFDVGGNPRYQS